MEQGLSGDLLPFGLILILEWHWSIASCRLLDRLVFFVKDGYCGLGRQLNLLSHRFTILHENRNLPVKLYGK